MASGASEARGPSRFGGDSPRRGSLLLAVTMIRMLAFVSGRWMGLLVVALRVAANETLKKRDHSTLEFGGRVSLSRLERLAQRKLDGFLGVRKNFIEVAHNGLHGLLRSRH
jgi:hypothetical protein